ncbi:peptide ABC transporter permease [Bordetella genomosp. 9]|uniref:Peptide ABC transporter permease n=1 Tax=Bordetella genomosp. 9 TaxID=1416803 RepID=A0A261RE72_9BORD|nr:ABC transporter permease [Bordetella genomosp. 9]OZI23319.1 peptide ABC transporter permease [Bordetella genomosp. 9]
MPLIVLLWTDVALYLIVVAVLAYGWHVRRTPTLRSTWLRVAHDGPAMCAAAVLAVFAVVGLLDSVHYRPRLPPLPDAAAGAPVAYAPSAKSLLDTLLAGTVLTRPEKTYSAPLAARQFTKETMLVDGQPVRDFPRLRAGAAHLKNPDTERWPDVAWRAGAGLAVGVAAALAIGGVLGLALGRRRASWRAGLRDLWRGDTDVRWRPMYVTLCAMCVVGGLLAGLATGYHPLGTDRTGNDVLWQAIKSVRTALVIGSLTTLSMLPPALGFGIAAGYFKGKVDDAITYLYTTLTSIPGVLLVAACVLMMQVYIDNNPTRFPTSAERADLRLFLLCLILGLTGWAGLCRLVRAEVLKLRELEYVQAARAFGVSKWGIMRRHLVPNVMHIVLITVVLEFSSLVLYEAVLSYLGIGVDPSMNSYGSMINSARLEMSMDPMIWWNLLTAFVFMLALVLSANLFADGVRAAFDPRARKFRARRTPVLAPPPTGGLFAISPVGAEGREVTRQQGDGR